MSTFVMIHGGWAGGWVWQRVAPLLAGQGHRVIAPDLPGHGDDHTPPDRITLDSYVQRVAETLDELSEPAVLVGHSSGGVVVTQAAERLTDRIERLVYVCAYLPADGQSLLELGQRDPDQLVLPNLVFSDDGATARIRSDVVGEALFADCSPADHERFAARATAEPIAPASTPVKVTPSAYGGLPKAYVECRRDRGISPELQRAMHSAAGCAPVVSMDTGHMPMYADPTTLARHLLTV